MIGQEVTIDIDPDPHCECGSIFGGGRLQVRACDELAWGFFVVTPAEAPVFPNVSTFSFCPQHRDALAAGLAGDRYLPLYEVHRDGAWYAFNEELPPITSRAS
jgi:hypothetical protein